MCLSPESKLEEVTGFLVVFIMLQKSNFKNVLNYYNS